MRRGIADAASASITGRGERFTAAERITFFWRLTHEADQDCFPGVTVRD
jgi:hypothetical protein